MTNASRVPMLPYTLVSADLPDWIKMVWFAIRGVQGKNPHARAHSPYYGERCRKSPSQVRQAIVRLKAAGWLEDAGSGRLTCRVPDGVPEVQPGCCFDDPLAEAESANEVNTSDPQTANGVCTSPGQGANGVNGSANGVCRSANGVNGHLNPNKNPNSDSEIERESARVRETGQRQTGSIVIRHLDPANLTDAGIAHATSSVTVAGGVAPPAVKTPEELYSPEVAPIMRHWQNAHGKIPKPVLATDLALLLRGEYKSPEGKIAPKRTAAELCATIDECARQNWDSPDSFIRRVCGEIKTRAEERAQRHAERHHGHGRGQGSHSVATDVRDCGLNTLLGWAATGVKPGREPEWEYFRPKNGGDAVCRPYANDNPPVPDTYRRITLSPVPRADYAGGRVS